MNKFRINKGLEKPVRFFGLDQAFAMEYFGAVAITWFFLFSTVGMTKMSLILYLLPIFIYYTYFKAKDKRNNVLNLKKRKAALAKPTIFKRDFGIKTEHEKLLNK